MKKILSLFLVIIMCMSLVACGNTTSQPKISASTTQASAEVETEKEPEVNAEVETEKESEVNAEAETEKEPEEVVAATEVEPEPEKVSYGIEEFETLLSQMPVFVKTTEYIVQDETHKALYPDMLQAVLQNNSSSDVKNAVVAFVAWDKNNLPVKIKSSIDFSDGAYVKLVNYNDINMVPESTFGENSGFEIDETCGIKTFKAIVVSYETFDGDTWRNPYFDEWYILYQGVKYNEELVVDVFLEDAAFESSQSEAAEDEEHDVSADALLAQIEEQEFKVASTKYIIQDANYKALYPDVLQVILQNNTSHDIKNAVVAFVAWDKNNLPVKIKGFMDFSDGAYIRTVNYNDINMVPKSTYGEKSGFEIDEACGIKTFKAIVVSYETFDGDTWKNPLYEDWCELYEGVKLK